MDSFLLTHRVNDFLFDIGCRFSPISIRDQMIRGFLIADRLQRSGLVGENKPLLIVGAGAAGATAALVASERNVPVTLVDRSGRAFFRQTSSTRYISPTLYDWPAAHYATGRFPPPSAVPLTLRWKEGQAGLIAATWAQRLTEQVNKRKRDRIANPSLAAFRFITRCEVVDAEKLINAKPNANKLVTVQFKDVTEKEDEPRRTFPPQDFAVIIGCSGPGKENCKATTGDFEGPPFWYVDSINHEDYILDEKRRRVLLSGGGDGALQDLIRLMTTCASPREILQVLPPKARRSLATHIRAAEDVYLRTFIWGIGHYDCRNNHNLDQSHRKAVNMVLDQYGSGLQDSLDQLLRGNVLRREITMVHPCDHFSNSYPINRVVAHLLIEFVRRRFDIEFVEPFRTVQKVWGSDHSCGPKTEECGRSPHMVQLAIARCQHVKDQTFEPFPRAENPQPVFDLIILRHGTKPQDLFGERPYGNHRQILPYHIERDWY